MNQHTPAPWFNWGTDHQGRRPVICSKAPGTGYSIASEIASVNTNQDAAFIVRAVNRDAAVDELIAVANRVRAVLNDEGKEVLTKAQMEDMLFQAIAKAEAK